jgi:hypothetical protein
MTKFSNAGITRKQTVTHGKLVEQNIEIAGVAGNDGGTITINGIRKIRNWVVKAYVAAGMVAVQASRIVDTTQPNTLVVTYTDPAADHKVKVTVWGVRG